MDLGSAFDGLFTVDFAIIPSGSVALNPTPADPAGAYASAGFDYGYSVGGVTGGDRALHTRNPDGSERMFNVNGPPPASVRLSGLQLGSVIPLRLFATAQAEVIAASHRQGFGIAAITDFSHALRWGGVTSISATDSFGNPIDLPAGFELSLIGASGFDYWGAAGSPPPVAGSAPEPGAWALMLVGFWGAGSRLRRRSVIAAA